jgi:adenylate kinase
MKVVAVVGISGVGKSTCIRQWAERFPFMHLQASALIKAEQAARNQAVGSSEELRLGPVLDNQALLVNAFRRATENYDGLVIFDGHTLIDGVDGPMPIPVSVFQALECEQIIFIHDTATTIAERRAKDKQRIRPQLSVEELNRHQDLALAAAQKVAGELGIELMILSQSVAD